MYWRKMAKNLLKGGVFPPFRTKIIIEPKTHTPRTNCLTGHLDYVQKYKQNSVPFVTNFTCNTDKTEITIKNNGSRFQNTS